MSKKSKKSDKAAKKLLKAQKKREEVFGTGPGKIIPRFEDPPSTPFLDRLSRAAGYGPEHAASTCSPSTYDLLRNAPFDFPEPTPDPYPSEYWHVRIAWVLVAFVTVSVIAGLLMTYWS